MMKKALLTTCLVTLPFLFTSCGTGSYTQQQNVTNGALVGAVAGGVIGHQSGHALEGAAIGAAAGGLAGHAMTPPQPYPGLQPYPVTTHPGCGH